MYFKPPTEYGKSPFLISWVIIAVLHLARPGMAQTPPANGRLPFFQLPLSDLSAFRTDAANWQIVGNVFADMKTEGVLNTAPGTGILANLMDPQNRSHLFTRFEHGDIEIEMEVMMVKGANSGIYLQGRYEVQLFDSWGKSEVKYGDMGGIYQRTDPVTQMGFEGYAPLLNASRAPGLWQKLYIHFKAPEFDANGKKTTDARFVRVSVNGVEVQKDVSVSGPTRSGAFSDERPSGPLMIQGNHGKVAFRNIRYKRYGRSKVAIDDISCELFATPGDSLRSYVGRSPLNALVKTDSVSWRANDGNETFLQRFKGKIRFPKKGDYVFRLQAGGGAMLVVDRDTLIFQDGANPFDRTGVGSYRADQLYAPFELIYNKPLQWREGLALFVEGPEIAMHPLHAAGSVFTEPPVKPLLIPVDSEKARIQRSFLSVGEEKKTHCLSVGTVEGIHYSIDLETGSLLQVWDGEFLDATPMWHRRGNQQTAIPLGARILMPSGHHFTGPAGEPLTLILQEYTLDQSGLPAFRYASGKVFVTDKLVPLTEGRGLLRSLKIRGQEGFSFVMASGVEIETLSEDQYAVNGKEYYLNFKNKELKREIREVDGVKELVIHSAATSGIVEIAYRIHW